MRIAVDFRVMSTEVADRGMGRYTQQQLREVLRCDGSNEYLVLLYQGLQQDLLFPEIRAAGNVTFQEVNLPDFGPIGREIIGPDRQLVFDAQFNDFLHRHGIDVFHDTAPFIVQAVTRIDACKVVSTLYDLIPFVFPTSYFQDAGQRQFYARCLHRLSHADGVIAISAAVRHDAYRYLGIAPERITVAYPCVEPCFRSLSDRALATALAGIRGKYTLPPRYLLMVSGVHHSKNAQTLLHAFGGLPASLRQAYPLVVVLPTETAHRTLVAQFTIPDHVRLLRSVPEADLVALYNGAVVAISPSRYEGFGYPLVEAMACGAPTISTTSSAVPEIAGDASLLVDPDDVQGFRQAITEVIGDADLRERLRLKGLQNALRFNLDNLGGQTLRAYEQAAAALPDHAGPRTPSRKSRRLALWSSFPPLQCGVGDYSAELVQALAGLADVEVFTDGGYLPRGDFGKGFAVFDYRHFAARERVAPFDAVIYQMGATCMQSYMYDQLRHRPGIVVVHDLLMGLGFFNIYYDSLRLETFRKCVLAPEGETVVAAFEDIMSTAAAAPHEPLRSLFQEHYLLRWITNWSLAQVVHSQSFQQDLEARYDNARVVTVDMGVADPCHGRPHRAYQWYRSTFQLPWDAFVVGIFGSVIPIKRLESVLAALGRVMREQPNTHLFVMGPRLDLAYFARLDTLVARLGLRRHVHFFDYQPRDQFDEAMLGCDVIVNLRYPTMKGMSAVLIRALAAGKPVITSDVPEWDYFPADCVWPANPVSGEVEQISEYLLACIRDPAHLLNAQRAARDFYVRRGTLAHMAQQYLDLVESVMRYERLGVDPAERRKERKCA